MSHATSKCYRQLPQDVSCKGFLFYIFFSTTVSIQPPEPPPRENIYFIFFCDLSLLKNYREKKSCHAYLKYTLLNYS